MIQFLCYLYGQILIELEDFLFSRLKTSFPTNVDMFCSSLWWFSKHRQALTGLSAGSCCKCGKNMKKVWIHRREVLPHPWLPARCRLTGLAASWSTQGQRALLIWAQARAIAEPASCSYLPLTFSSGVLFHMNGLKKEHFLIGSLLFILYLHVEICGDWWRQSDESAWSDSEQ